MQSWQVQEAKARFSELMRDAVANGPQAITVRGAEDRRSPLGAGLRPTASPPVLPYRISPDFTTCRHRAGH